MARKVIKSLIDKKYGKEEAFNKLFKYILFHQKLSHLEKIVALSFFTVKGDRIPSSAKLGRKLGVYCSSISRAKKNIFRFCREILHPKLEEFQKKAWAEEEKEIKKFKKTYEQKKKKG